MFTVLNVAEQPLIWALPNIISQKCKAHYQGNITTIRKHIVSQSQHLDSQNAAAISEKTTDNSVSVPICRPITAGWSCFQCKCFHSDCHVPNRVVSWQRSTLIFVRRWFRISAGTAANLIDVSLIPPGKYGNITSIRPRPLPSPLQFTCYQSPLYGPQLLTASWNNPDRDIPCMYSFKNI